MGDKRIYLFKQTFWQECYDVILCSRHRISLEFGERICVTIITKHGSMTRCLWLYFTETYIFRRSNTIPHRCICTSRRSRSSPSPRHPSLISAEQISLPRTNTNALISTVNLHTSPSTSLLSPDRLISVYNFAGTTSSPVQFFFFLLLLFFFVYFEIVN